MEADLDPWDYGVLAPEAFDYLVCSIIRAARASALARLREHDNGQRFIDTYTKPGYAGGAPLEVANDIDVIAQAEAVRWMRRWLPEFGIIAEEGGLRIPAPHARPHEYELTLDGCDGSAFLSELLKKHLQPRAGVCIMVGVRLNGKTIAAYVLDMFSGQLLRVPPARGTILVSNDSVPEAESLPVELAVDTPAFLSAGMLCLHGAPERHSHLMRLLHEGLFDTVASHKGGLGSSISNLVTGQAKTVAVARPPDTSCTPWGDIPTAFLCRTAGIRTFWVRPDRLQEFVLTPPESDPAPPNEHGILYVPDRYVGQLRAAEVPMELLPAA